MRYEPDQRNQGDDRPTVPSLHPHVGDASERDFGGSRTWPVGAGRAPAGHTAPRDVLPLALGASVGLNVALLLGLVAVLVLARAGAFSPSGGSSGAPSTAIGTATSAALSTPTTSLSNGLLQVAPSSVQLGCDGDQRTQFVVLTNGGPQDVQWQAVLGVPADQAAVELSPNHGTLHAGASIVLQIQSRTLPTTQQGVIRFTTSAAQDAGNGTSTSTSTGPSLSYIAQGCG